MRVSARISALLFFLAAATPALSGDPGNGVWHLIEPGDRLFLQDRTNLTGAGIVQENGRLARLYLVPNEEGAVASVTLPDTNPDGALVSTLRIDNRGLFSRTIPPDRLLIEGPDDTGRTTFSFAISQSDIELFMAARDWRVRVGNTAHTLSLKGSRQAITQALETVATAAPAIAEGSDPGLPEDN